MTPSRPATKARLDQLLVDKGLAASRERARALVLAGLVTVDGKSACKSGHAFPLDADIRVTAPDHPYVGRGALKLAHALEHFAVDVTGWTALDVGASTGGFTDVLLRRGAATVVALDVGHGQLAWSLRTDPRVVVLEKINARTLTPDQLPPTLRAFDLITVDVSFISLRLVLAPLSHVLKPGAGMIVLVKPQFEAGRAEVGRGGIIRDAAIHRRVVDEISAAATALAFHVTGIIPSPIVGADGNQEFLIHLRWTR